MGKLLARAFLFATGWRPEGARPQVPSFVLIAAPHTSNWDLVYLLAFATVFDIRISWMAKHSLFRPPMGWAMRWLGGIPVVRHRSGNLVAAMAGAFKETDGLALVVPAEGTRARVPHWKSGFYQIAKQANVPIVLGYLDYARRRGGFGPALLPSGDVSSDMDEIRAFYADKTGRYPERFGPVQLKDES